MRWIKLAVILVLGKLVLLLYTRNFSRVDNSIQSNVWDEIDCVRCIAMASAVERRMLFQAEAERVGLGGTRVTYQLEEPDPDGGTAGCFRAHVRAAQAAVSEGCSNLLVFEADAYFKGDLVGTLKNVSHFLRQKPDYDMLLLGHNPVSNTWATKFAGLRRAAVTFGGHARILSRNFMEKVAALTYKNLHLDNKLVLMRPIIYVAYPMIAFQRDHYSTVTQFKNKKKGHRTPFQRYTENERRSVTKKHNCYLNLEWWKKNMNDYPLTMTADQRRDVCSAWAADEPKFHVERFWKHLDCVTVITTANNTSDEIKLTLNRLFLSGRAHIQFGTRDPRGGVRGCFEAHRRAAIEALEQNCNNVLVLEDDATVLNFTDVMKRARLVDNFIATHPYDVVYLGHFPKGQLLPVLPNIVRTTWSVDGVARILSRKTMAAMANLEWEGLHMDNVLPRVAEVNYAVVPQIVFQRGRSKSAVTNTHTESFDMVASRQKKEIELLHGEGLWGSCGCRPVNRPFDDFAILPDEYNARCVKACETEVSPEQEKLLREMAKSARKEYQ